MREECPFHLKTVSKMEPLEYRSVIKFLNMQGQSPVIFEEMFSVYQEQNALLMLLMKLSNTG